MKSTLIEFEKKITQLCDYLICWKDIQNDLMDFQQKHQIQLPESILNMIRNPNKKVFDYKLAILIIYGSFESYIENIIEQYVSKLNSAVGAFTSLPMQIQSNHTELSARLLGFICAGYSKYEQFSSADIVERLHSCYSSPQNYKLNVSAFTQHTANLRINVIRELFSGIGITGIDSLIMHNESFVCFLKEIDPELSILLDEQQGEARYERCFQCLNDIIERRNDIAHGVDDADDNILSTDVLLEYSNYIVEIAKSIYSIVIGEYARITILSRGNNILYLGCPISVFNNNIVCFNSRGYKISIGDIIASMNAKNQVRVGEIKSLQIDGNFVKCIPAEDTHNFGAKINFHANKNYNYYIVKY